MKKSIMVCALFVSAVFFSSFSAQNGALAVKKCQYAGCKFGHVGIGIWKRPDADSSEMKILKMIKTTFDSDKAFLPSNFGCDYYMIIKEGTITFSKGKNLDKEGKQLFDQFFGDSTSVIKNATLEVYRMPAGPSLSIDLYFNSLESAMGQMVTFIKAYH